MSIIAEMPAEAVIGRLRGVLDFYKWCELNIVRTWPRAPGRTRSIPCALVGQQFSYVNKEAGSLEPELHALYSEMSTGTAFTWKDWMTRLYVNASYKLQETQLH